MARVARRENECKGVDRMDRNEEEWREVKRCGEDSGGMDRSREEQRRLKGVERNGQDWRGTESTGRLKAHMPSR